MKGRTVQIPGVLLTIAQACHRNLTPPSAFPLQAGGGIATLCPRAGLSPAGPARRKPMPSFSESLEKTLHNALKAASERHHEYATLEHLLSALIDDEHAAEVMRACGVALDELQSAVVHYLATALDSLTVEIGRPSSRERVCQFV